MNISAMRKDWKNEGKNIIKKNINQSLRRGTYNNKNIEGFLTDVNVNETKDLHIVIICLV